MSQRRAAFVLGLVLVAAPAAAAEQYVFRPFVMANYSMPTDSTPGYLGKIEEVELSDELGWEAGLEWRFSRVFGLEASYGRVVHDITFGGQVLAEATAETVYVGLNLHIFAGHSFDLYVAPTMAFVDWKMKGVFAGILQGDDSDSGFGVTVGIDWPLGETWAVSGGLRFTDTQIEIGDGTGAVDPLVVRLGIAARL